MADVLFSRSVLGSVETGSEFSPTRFVRNTEHTITGGGELDIQFAFVYLSGKLNVTELKNSKMLNRQSPKKKLAEHRWLHPIKIGI